MNVHEAIQERRSVRAYKSQPVPDESLARVLEAARLAPSASNRQDYKFIVVKDASKREKMVEASANQRFVGEAPVIIVAVSTNPGRNMSCDVPAYAVDCAIAVENMLLAAAGEGLGTCWIGAFSQAKVKALLGIPEKYKVAALFPLGYPADKPGAKHRKTIDQLICKETFYE